MNREVFSDITRRVVTYGLPGQASGRIAAATKTPGGIDPLPDDRWRALLTEVARHRVPGLLVAAIEGGALFATDAQREAAIQQHVQACSSVLGLERHLIDIVTLLEDAGIEVVVLKGSAHAHLCYPDPALRHFGDVDVLVASARLRDAIALLERERGARRQVPELRPGFDRRFAKSVTLLDPAGVEIDLHRTLLFGTFAFAIDEAELWADSQPFTVGGHPMRALRPEVRLLHANLHAGLGDKRPRGNSMRDLAQLWLTRDHDQIETMELARRWRLEAVLTHGLSLCREFLDVVVPGVLADTVRDRQMLPEERSAIDSYVGPNPSHAAKVRASLPFIDRPGAKVAFLSASVLPGSGFLSARRKGRLRWLQRGARSLRGQ